jgi:dTDP-glucose pyrophosphorylase/predicted transcriptional regulator
MTGKLPIVNTRDASIDEQATILAAMQAINKTDARIALVIDKQGRLAGSITDGDIRRGLLAGKTLESAAREVMHTTPFVMPASTPRQDLLNIMQERGIRQIPLVREDGTFAGITTDSLLEGISHTPRGNPVIIMAGGKGKRLLPITTDIPKPMVEIHGKPMLEWIIQRFVHQGFSEFHLAINHLGHIIEQYFGDGKKFHCRIHYLREQEFLGTAGALSLFSGAPSEPILVINGDILAAIDFGSIIDYHASTESIATVCARPHRMEVPYGVIQLKDGMLEAIVEKPVYEDLVSAGIYVLDPKALKFVPKNQITDMPTLLANLVSNQQKVAVFPMREDWVDVGRHDDLERAKHTLSGAANG